MGANRLGLTIIGSRLGTYYLNYQSIKLNISKKNCPSIIGCGGAKTSWQIGHRDFGTAFVVHPYERGVSPIVISQMIGCM